MSVYSIVIFVFAFGSLSERIQEPGAALDAKLQDMKHLLPKVPFSGDEEYPVAREFERPWTRRGNLRKVIAEFFKKLLDKENEEELSVEEYMKTYADLMADTGSAKMRQKYAQSTLSEAELEELMQLLVLIPNQKLVAARGYRCTNLCAVCLPPQGAFKEGTVNLKSIFIGRKRGWRGDLSLPLIGVLDAGTGVVLGKAGGKYIGPIGGIAAAAPTGAAVFNATFKSLSPRDFLESARSPDLTTLGGIALGALAGLSLGTVTYKVVNAMVKLILPLFGAWRGVGITGAFTGCDRVGFRAFVNERLDKKHSYFGEINQWKSGIEQLREKMDYDRQTAANTLEFGLVPGEDPDYEAILHCEYLRRRNFDVRHIPECMKHTMLCGGGGAIVLPVRNQKMCQAMSNETGLMTPHYSKHEKEAAAPWTDARSFGKCVKLLCTYDGHKKGIALTNPENLQRTGVQDSEIIARCSRDYENLNKCRYEFKNLNGEDFTLNTAAERERMCGSEPWGKKCFD